jgi:hypothetical protein
MIDDRKCAISNKKYAYEKFVYMHKQFEELKRRYDFNRDNIERIEQLIKDQIASLREE